MIDSIFSLAHSVFSNRGVFAVLLGSGLSSASGIPTGWQVTLDLVRRLAALEGENPTEDAEAWYVERHSKTPNYSELLHALAKTAAERRSLLHAYFEPTTEEREQALKVPSPGHRAVARLVTKGYIKVILTTNFDRLIETALRDEGIEPTVISTPDAAEGAAPLVHQRCVVVKLHGDYLDDRIKNTEIELATYDQRMDVYLDRVLEDFGLIICGWSGEWDAALRAAIERCKSRRYSTYWASNRALGPRADMLATLRQAQRLSIKDADSFFSNLDEKVSSLEELQSPATLSVAAAVASLKRYIVDRQHRIRLHDLLMDETARAKERLAAEIPVDHRMPDGFEFKRRLFAVESCTEILRHLYFHGGLWAQPENYEVFKRPQQMIVPRSIVGGTVVWIDFQTYPVALLTYTGGFGAIAGGNYPLLRELLTVQFDHNGKNRDVLRSLANAFGHAGDLVQSLHPERRYTPISDHLARMLEPMAEAYVPDPEFLFDTLEIMISLSWLDTMDPLPSAPQRMPWGRFAWKGRTTRNRPADVVFAEAEKQAAEWAPLKAGMFGGSTRRFEAVRALFEASLKEIADHLW